MKKMVWIVLAVTTMGLMAGCASKTATKTTTSSPRYGSSSVPVSTGLKPAGQVAPCCRALAEGRISLDQCMENPTCKANGRMCCFQAIE